MKTWYSSKIFVNFIRFFWAKMCSHSRGKNVLIPQYCILLHCFSATFNLPTLPVHLPTFVKWLQSGASLYTFSVTAKTRSWRKWQWVFSTFYLKGLQSEFFVAKSFNILWLRIYNFCFKSETILKAFNARRLTLSSCL